MPSSAGGGGAGVMPVDLVASFTNNRPPTATSPYPSLAPKSSFPAARPVFPVGHHCSPCLHPDPSGWF